MRSHFSPTVNFKRKKANTDHCSGPTHLLTDVPANQRKRLAFVAAIDAEVGFDVKTGASGQSSDMRTRQASAKDMGTLA